MAVTVYVDFILEFCHRPKSIKTFMLIKEDLDYKDMDRYENRRWLFLNSGDMSEVNFGQVLQTNADTCRYSLDGEKAFIKYETTTYPIDINAENVDSEGNTYNFEHDSDHNVISSGIAFASGEVVGRPDIFNKALTISGKEEFTHQETLEILQGEDWTEPIPQL